MNVKLSRDKSHAYFLFRQMKIAKIDLDSLSYNPKNLIKFGELKEIMKFETEVLDSEVVALGVNGLLKLSKGNTIFKLSSKSNIPSKLKINPYRWGKILYFHSF